MPEFVDNAAWLELTVNPVFDPYAIELMTSLLFEMLALISPFNWLSPLIWFTVSCKVLPELSVIATDAGKFNPLKVSVSALVLAPELVTVDVAVDWAAAVVTLTAYPAPELCWVLEPAETN
jgi:hypothetical protein